MKKQKLESIGIYKGKFETKKEMLSRSKNKKIEIGTYVKISRAEHKNNGKIGRIVSYYEEKNSSDYLDHIVHFGPNNFSIHNSKDFLIFKIIKSDPEGFKNKSFGLPLPTVSEINAILAKKYKEILK